MKLTEAKAREMAREWLAEPHAWGLSTSPNRDDVFALSALLLRVAKEEREAAIEEAAEALATLYKRYRRERSQPMDFGRKESISAIIALHYKRPEEGGEK